MILQPRRVTLQPYAVYAMPPGIGPIQWQQSPVVIAKNQYCLVTADPAGTWFASGRDCGPYGDGAPATGSYYFTELNAMQGCLLVMDGGGKMAPFTQLIPELEMHNPGPLSFLANCDTNGGYATNSGFINVTVTILAWDESDRPQP